MIRPFGWLRQRTAGWRIASTTFRVSRSASSRCPACSDSCTQSSSASTSSGRSSVPSRRMSHSVPRSTRNGASRSFTAAISSAWRRNASASSPGTTLHVRRVVADRDVLVAEVARGERHLLDRRLPVGPGRVAVQVAADLRELDEGRRIAVERRLAQLGRAPRQPEQRVDARPRSPRRAAARATRRTPASPSRARAPFRSDCRRGDDELDRDAVDGDADRTPLRPLDDRDDRREGGEPVEHGRRIGGGADDRELVHDVAPAAHLARDLAVELVRDRHREGPRTVDRQPAAAAALAGEAREDLPLGRRPDPRRLLQAARGGRFAQLVGRCGCRARGRARPCAADRARRAGRARRAAARPRARAPPARRAAPSSRARCRRASIPRPIPRSSRTRPARTSSATGARVSRTSSAARRYARTE